MKYLARTKKPKSALEISKALGITKGAANNNIKKLLNQKVVLVTGFDDTKKQYRVRLFKSK